VPSTMSSGCFDPQREEDAVSTEPEKSAKKPGTPQARLGSKAGSKADRGKPVQARRTKPPSKRTRIALRAADPTPAKRGRPAKFDHELVCTIIDESIAQGKGVVKQLKQHNIYRWIDDHPDLSERYEDAKRARTRLSQERLWALAENENDEGATGRRTAAMLIEKAMAFQESAFQHVVSWGKI
jgi:hypothetical protein